MRMAIHVQNHARQILSCCKFGAMISSVKDVSNAGGLQEWMNSGDLAPGDQKSLSRRWDGFSLHRILSAEDPNFDLAFSLLWREFGEKGEVESADVLAQRLRWPEEPMSDGACLRYEFLLVVENGVPVAVRDHTAIVVPGISQAVVHMSHNLVMLPWRRCGIAGWLRALPVQTGRLCLEKAGLTPLEPVLLVAEMEAPNPDDVDKMARLIAYEKAGYLKVDPDRVHYLQPDFRPSEQIDATGGPAPIPLCLLIRRVGSEDDRVISGAEVRGIVRALYAMYAKGFRDSDMRLLNESLDDYPAPDAAIDLVSPTKLI